VFGLGRGEWAMIYFQDYLSVLKYNIKILFGLNLLAAIILVVLTPLFFSLKLLPLMEMAKVGELYLSIVGIMLFPFLINIEERDHINELVFIKRTSHVYIFIVRFIIFTFIALLMFLGIASFAEFQGSSFKIFEFTAGVGISALFLGVIGMTVVNITNELSAGYLISFAYFVFELLTKGKYTKDFYLQSLLKGSFNEKYYILAVTIVLFIVNLVIINKKS
jgi:hypothetical protein